MADTFDGVDRPTVQAILALQLQDAEALFEVAPDGSITDVACAAALLLTDLRMEQAITAAVSDAPAADADAMTEPVANPVQEPQTVHHECISCRDIIGERDLVQVSCQHHYCAECLESLVRQSLVDETLYPPRCCQTLMDWESIQTVLPPALVGQFEAKVEELNSMNRTYCHRSACSTFIGAAGIVDDRATCPQCQQVTCTICKKVSHDGDCPDDQDLRSTLNLANQEGWQRCQACKRVVELNTGCNHITCICRAEFCYVCGVAWKHCECPQWHENNLYARTENIANRSANHIDHNVGGIRGLGRVGGPARGTRGGGRGSAAARRANRDEIDAAAANLRANHDCAHANWTEERDGPHRCEVCNDMLPIFIFNCDQCNLQACFRCRHNRL